MHSFQANWDLKQMKDCLHKEYAKPSIEMLYDYVLDWHPDIKKQVIKIVGGEEKFKEVIRHILADEL